MKWISFICRFWIAAFGTLSWSAPAWLKNLMARAWQTRPGRWLNSKMLQARQEPRKAGLWIGGLSVGVVVLLTSAFYLKQYWDSLPQPDYVAVKIQPPSASEAETKLVHGFSVVFSKSAARLEKIGKDVSSEVELKPAVPGVWKWLDDKTLNFEPQGVVAFKTDWLPGETYEVRFKKSLFPDHLLFKSYVESFKVADLIISSSKKEFYIDPQNPSIKKGILNFYSNYPIDIEDFKKRVNLIIRSSDNETLKGSSTTLAPRISTNPLQTEIYVETQNLEIPKVDSYITITIDKGSRATRGGRSSDKEVSERVFVPGLYSALKIDNHEIIFARNEKFEPEQVLVFETGIAVKGEDVQKALTVLLLPAEHHQPNSKKIIKNYVWNSTGEVTAEIKKNSQTVDLELIPTDQPYSTLHSFKVKVPVHRHLWMQVKKDLTGLGGYKLGNTYETIVHIPDYTPELLFMSEGSLLTLSGEKKLPLLARNVIKTKFTIARILPQQINFLIAKMLDSGSFKKPYLYAETENMIAEKFNEEISLPTKEKAATTYFSLDMNPYKTTKAFFTFRPMAKLRRAKLLLNKV